MELAEPANWSTATAAGGGVSSLLQAPTRRKRRGRRRRLLSLVLWHSIYVVGTNVECKGLVGKLPGNPASCQEEPCNSDPQHVLYALKWTSFGFGLILLLPLLMYYISKLISKLHSMCGGSSSGSPTKADASAASSGGGSSSCSDYDDSDDEELELSDDDVKREKRKKRKRERETNKKAKRKNSSSGKKKHKEHQKSSSMSSSQGKASIPTDSSNINNNNNNNAFKHRQSLVAGANAEVEFKQHQQQQSNGSVKRPSTGPQLSKLSATSIPRGDENSTTTTTTSSQLAHRDRSTSVIGNGGGGKQQHQLAAADQLLASEKRQQQHQLRKTSSPVCSRPEATATAAVADNCSDYNPLEEHQYGNFQSVQQQPQQPARRSSGRKLAAYSAGLAPGYAARRSMKIHPADLESNSGPAALAQAADGRSVNNRHLHRKSEGFALANSRKVAMDDWRQHQCWPLEQQQQQQQQHHQHHQQQQLQNPSCQDYSPRQQTNIMQQQQQQQERSPEVSLISKLYWDQQQQQQQQQQNTGSNLLALPLDSGQQHRHSIDGSQLHLAHLDELRRISCNLDGAAAGATDRQTRAQEELLKGSCPAATDMRRSSRSCGVGGGAGGSRRSKQPAKPTNSSQA